MNAFTLVPHKSFSYARLRHNTETLQNTLRTNYFLFIYHLILWKRTIPNDSGGVGQGKTSLSPNQTVVEAAKPQRARLVPALSYEFA